MTPKKLGSTGREVFPIALGCRSPEASHVKASALLTIDALEAS
jgi:hypothetical protein